MCNLSIELLCTEGQQNSQYDVDPSCKMDSGSGKIKDFAKIEDLLMCYSIKSTCVNEMNDG